MLVEKVGVQTQTAMKDPFNLTARRIVLGPGLYFRADGSRDPDPIHYWGLGSQAFHQYFHNAILETVH